MMQPLAIVPARGNSKRLPGKNIRELGGVALINWTIFLARKMNLPCLLTTDDAETRRLGQSSGAWAPFLRPADLATDEATTESVVLHALDYLKEHDAEPEAFMLLQPTSPFREEGELQAAIDMMTPTVNAVVSVKPLHRGPDRIFAYDQFRLWPLSRDAAPCYVANGALYLVRTQAFREHASLTPPKTKPVFMSERADLDIDTELDWAIAEWMVESMEAEDARYQAGAA